jgi:hypothetical protein
MAFRSEISTEERIEGTTEEVWAVLSDFGAYGDWNPGMEEVEGEAVVGSRLSIVFKLKGHRTMKMRPTVLAAEPGRELRWIGHLLMPGIFDGEHRFEIHADGLDRVRFVQGERFKGVLVPFLRKTIEVDTVQTFGAVNAALAARVAELRNVGPA